MIDAVKKILRNLPFPAKSLIKAIFAPRYYGKILINDLRALVGPSTNRSRIIFVAGYPKSGTTWVENFISRIPGYNPRILAGSDEILRQHNLPVDAFSRIPRYSYSAIKTHIIPNKQNIDNLVKNDVNKVLVMYRDPRDVIVSMYYYILRHNPWEPSDSCYADYSKMTKVDALSHAMNVIAEDFPSWVRGWRNVAEVRPEIDCLVVRYEDLLRDAVTTFQSILAFYNVKIKQTQFDTLMLASNRTSGKSLLKLPGEKTTKRKGIAGEWEKELNNEQKAILKDKMGDILIELGYEVDRKW